MTTRSWLNWLLQPFMAFAVLMLAAGLCAARQTVYVKILVDEEEVAPEAAWKQRLRDRLEAANQVIAKYTRVRFAVLEFEKWQSDNRENDFGLSLKQFESDVDRGSAEVAIGFTSQYQLKIGRDQLGGTRGVLHSHILIREGNPKVFESDRLEVLVHELGHYLGAAHSAEPDSVMRPVVADGRARLTGYQIHFDRENAEILRLVGLEYIDRHAHRFADFSPATLQKLRLQYARIVRNFPEDPAANRYLKMIDAAQGPSEVPGPLPGPPRPFKIPPPGPNAFPPLPSAGPSQEKPRAEPKPISPTSPRPRRTSRSTLGPGI